jgi:hypothetical protein
LLIEAPTCIFSARWQQKNVFAPLLTSPSGPRRKVMRQFAKICERVILPSKQVATGLKCFTAICITFVPPPDAQRLISRVNFYINAFLCFEITSNPLDDQNFVAAKNNVLHLLYRV